MKLSLFVFIDAYGWELFKRWKVLKGELRTTGPLQTVLGYSSACDPTILTGLKPQEHGHFSFFYYAKKGSSLRHLRFLRFLPKRLARSGRVRNWISRIVAWMAGFRGYFQLYQAPFRYLDLLGYSEKRDLYQEGGINSGAETFFDQLRERNIPFHCSDWRKSERRNLASLRKSISEEQPRCAYLYLAAMDGLLHHRGTECESVEQKLRWYDRELRELLKYAKAHYKEVDLHLFSDHGMTDVEECCDLMKRVDATGLVFGRDYVAVYDSTMARFWFLHQEARELIEDALKDESRGRWLSDSELEHLGCRFEDEFYGEAFFLLRPGVLLCPSFMGHKPVAGMHGYHPLHKDSTALFASTRELCSPPRKLTDLYKFMMQEVL